MFYHILRVRVGSNFVLLVKRPVLFIFYFIHTEEQTFGKNVHMNHCEPRDFCDGANLSFSLLSVIFISPTTMARSSNLTQVILTMVIRATVLITTSYIDNGMWLALVLMQEIIFLIIQQRRCNAVAKIDLRL